MRTRLALLFVVMQIAAGDSGTLTNVHNEQQCSADDPDIRIRGCTALIQSGQDESEKLASAFYKRALPTATRTNRPAGTISGILYVKPC